MLKLFAQTVCSKCFQYEILIKLLFSIVKHFYKLYKVVIIGALKAVKSLSLNLIHAACNCDDILASQLNLLYYRNLNCNLEICTQLFDVAFKCIPKKCSRRIQFIHYVVSS